MKKIFFATLISAGLVACTALTACLKEKHNNDGTDENSKIEVGDAVPSFTVFDSEGAEVTFSEFPKTLILFFNVQCPTCQHEFPAIQAAWSELRDEGLEFIGVARPWNTETAGELAELTATYWEEHGFDMPWYTDPGRYTYSKFATLYIPRLYLAVDGVVVWKAMGELNMTSAKLIATIKSKLDAAPIPAH